MFALSSDIVLLCGYWLTRSDSKCHCGASLSQMSSENLSCYKFGSRITCSLMGWGKFAQLWFVKAFQRQVGWLKKHTQAEQNEGEMECCLTGLHVMINPFTPSLQTRPGKHGMFALGVTSIVICGVLIWAGNSDGQCSTRLPEVDFQTFRKVPHPPVDALICCPDAPVLVSASSAGCWLCVRVQYARVS